MRAKLGPMTVLIFSRAARQPLDHSPTCRVLIGELDCHTAASQSLGMTSIPAMVFPISGIQADLAEIDENPMRNDLHELERRKCLVRRRTIYEAIHPIAKAVHESGISVVS